MIISESDKRVQVADGNVNEGKYKVKLPFQGLSEQANTGDTFEKFNDSLLSVGAINDDGNISIFTSPWSLRCILIHCPMLCSSAYTL